MDLWAIQPVFPVQAPLLLLVNFLLFVVVSCIYSRWFHPLSTYPGPFSASISNLWRFVKFFSFEHHLVEKDVHDKYGAIVRLGPSSLSFSSLEAYEAIYGFHHEFEKGDWYDFVRDPFTGEAPVFGLRSYTAHRERRKQILGPALSSAKVAGYKPVILKHVEELVKAISEARKQSSTSKFINIPYILNRFTLETIFEVVNGVPLAYNVPENREKIPAHLRLSSALNFSAGLLPWLQSLVRSRIGGSIIRRPRYSSSGALLGLSAPLGQISSRVLSVCRDSSAGTQPCVIDNLRHQAGEDSKEMNPGIIISEAINMFFAGPGSTATALTSVLYYLGKPESKAWQARIRKDCEAGSPQSSATLAAVVKETLRLNPPFPAAFPRDTASEVNSKMLPGIQGSIPTGTTVSCNLYVLGRSKEAWGEDAEQWKPERWLEQNAEAGEQSSDGNWESEKRESMKIRKPDEKLVSFGRGPRMCMGREIAMIMIGEAVAAVLSKWDIESVGRLEGKNVFDMQYDLCEIELNERV